MLLRKISHHLDSLSQQIVYFIPKKDLKDSTKPEI